MQEGSTPVLDPSVTTGFRKLGFGDGRCVQLFVDVRALSLVRIHHCFLTPIYLIYYLSAILPGTVVDIKALT